MSRTKTIPPLKAYTLLLEYFGPQGWWPTTRPGQPRPGYHGIPPGSLTETERFEICAGALLTQNTAWRNVEKAFENLFREQLLSVEKITAVEHSRLAELLRPSGYYNQKALRLKTFALHLLEKHGGSTARLLSQPLDVARRELLSLKGVGPETADSMLLYAGGRESFVIDAYTRRIGARLGWYATEDYDELQGFFQERLPRSAPVYNEYHALLVALGKDYCRPKPRCEQCPLRKGCPHGK